MGKKLDLTGQRYGKLTVIKEAESKIINDKKISQWECLCDCGNLTTIPIGQIRSGHTKSCGKCNYIDLTGQMFGKWMVIKRVEDYISPKGIKDIQWLCECQCEKKTRKTIRGSILKHGDSKSCGCLFNLEYDLSGEYGIGYTQKGEAFYFDLEDYNLIKNYTWHYDKDNYIVANTINAKGNKSTIKMHRIVMDVLDDHNIEVDHIKHINYDNRKSQLRLASSSQNNMNTKTPKTSTSRHKGVNWDKSRNKWAAYITLNRKHKYLGRFDNIEDAIYARREAELKYHTDYNYIDSITS